MFAAFALVRLDAAHVRGLEPDPRNARLAELAFAANGARAGPPGRSQGHRAALARAADHRDPRTAHVAELDTGLQALGATLRTDRRELPLGELYRLPTEDDRNVTALQPGELILELDVPKPEASTYLKAMDRTTFSFALVGVGAARFTDGLRLALAGVAPIPWRLDSPKPARRSSRRRRRTASPRVLLRRHR